MNYQKYTKSELISKLKKLSRDYASLGSVYKRDINECRRVEKSLKESEERYRLLFKNSGEAILLTNPDGSIYDANPEACRIFGRSKEEICRIGRNGLVDLSDPRLKSSLKERRRNGKFKGELNFRRKDGSIFQGEISSNIFADASGCIRTSMLIRDISEKKKAEADLKESESKFKGIFENSVVGISAAYPDGRIFMVNRAFVRMYGFKDKEELLKMGISGKIVSADPKVRLSLLKTLRRKGYIDRIEVEVLKKDGSHFFVLLSAREIKDANGNLLYTIGTHIDITYLKKIENKIHDASLYARTLIEASLDPLVTISRDGKISDVNLATEKITGLNRDRLIGSDFADYFTDPVKARMGYRKVFSKGKVKDYPLTILNTKGKKVDVLYNATLFKNEKNEIQGVFAAARDITDRKRIEEQLRESTKMLETLNQHLIKVREDERAMISREIHDELGQSLTALKLDLNLLREQSQGSSEVKVRIEGMIDLISQSIQNVQRISSDLRPGILDDLGLLPAVEWYCSEFGKRTGIRCDLRTDSSEYGNAGINLTLFRIMQEALTNVIRHSGASTVIVDLRKTSKAVTLSIRDNGKGISREKINSGNSLGLVGIRERIRQYNGRLSIISRKGTKLTVSIPETKAVYR